MSKVVISDSLNLNGCIRRGRMHSYENITFCVVKDTLDPMINSNRYTQSFDIAVFRGYTGEVLVAFLKSIYIYIYIYNYICSVCEGGGAD